MIKLYDLFTFFGGIPVVELIYNKVGKNKEGYFDITETNYPTHCINNQELTDIYSNMYKNLYDLKKPIHFSLKGNVNVYLLNVTKVINGREVHNGVPHKTIFTLDRDRNILDSNLDLRDYELDNEEIQVIWILDLKPITGRKYKQKIYATFKKIEGSKYELIKYNFLY